MAKLLEMLNPLQTDYVDRRFKGNEEEYHRRLAASTTLYIGNLSFFTTEEQIYEVFSKAGDVKRIVMGLDRQKKTPCGFCFVVYYTQRDAKAAIKYLNGTMVDERPVRVDLDYGFEEGRQFGRGLSGGQVRDEFRTDYDEGRGGWGHQLATELSALPVAAAGGQAQFYGAGQRAPHAEGRGRQREGDDEGADVQQAKRVRVEERNPRYRDRGDDRDEDDERRQGGDVGAGPVSHEAEGGDADGGVAGDGDEASVGGGDGVDEHQQEGEQEGQQQQPQRDKPDAGTMEAEAY